MNEPLSTVEEAEPILQFFRFSHLPLHLASVSMSFHHLAMEVVIELPRNAERTVALRKLLETKDPAVRAKIYQKPSPPVSAGAAPLDDVNGRLA